MRFKKNDDVLVTDEQSQFFGKTGKVAEVRRNAIYRNRGFCDVDIGTLRVRLVCEQLAPALVVGASK